jgi:hypothetical protein
MTARFNIDLLHTGRIAETWQDRLVGQRGREVFMLFALASLVILIVGYVIGVLIPSRGLVHERQDVARLNAQLASRTEDLRLIKAGLGALSEEARRQIRWSDLLTTLSEQIPSVLRLQRVALTKVVPGPPGQAPATAAAAAARAEGVLQIDAQTPLQPGGPPLLETAKFMGGVMRDPAVNKRFTLRSWEIKPPAGTGPTTDSPLLQINVTLAERLP